MKLLMRVEEEDFHMDRLITTLLKQQLGLLKTLVILIQLEVQQDPLLGPLSLEEEEDTM
jgi:hypothetical protein